jgi:hypothetical protein
MSFDTPDRTPFNSAEHVDTERPGLVCTARIKLFLGDPVRVHDAFVAAVEGILFPAVLVFSVVDVRGRDYIAQGELMRWHSEAV